MCGRAPGTLCGQGLTEEAYGFVTFKLEVHLRLPALRVRQAEALRCWRTLAQHGLPVASLDDMFAPLSALLGPPDWDSLIAGLAGGAPSAAAAEARLAATAEAHLLAAALIAQARCPPPPPGRRQGACTCFDPRHDARLAVLLGCQ